MIQTKLEHVKKVYNHVKSNRNKANIQKEDVIMQSIIKNVK